MIRWTSTSYPPQWCRMRAWCTSGTWPGSSAPWEGVSPLVSAGVIGKDAGRHIEKKPTGRCFKQPTGGLITQPDGSNARCSPSRRRQALMQGKGGINAHRDYGGWLWARVRASAPRQDWDQKRFGPMPPAANIQLWEAAMRAVMAALGVNPSLYIVSGVGATRESYRHLFSGTIVPLGQLIAAELSEKLERNIT